MPPLDIYRQAFSDMGFGSSKWGIDRSMAGIGKWGIDPTAITMAPSLTGLNTVMPGTAGLFSGTGASSVVTPPTGPSVGGGMPSMPVAPASSGYGGASYAPTSYAPTSYGTSASPAAISYTPSTGGGDWAGVDQWDSIVQQVSRETGVPPNVIKSIMQIESQGDPNAMSSQGYYGLMQTGPDSAVPSYMTDYNWLAQSPYNQILAGATELQNKYDAVGTGNWADAAGAYLGYGVDANGTSTSMYQSQFQANLDYLNSQAPNNASVGPTAAAGFGAPDINRLGIGSVSAAATGTMPQTIYRTAAPSSGVPAGSPGGWISSITSGQQHPISQEFGLTEYATGEGAWMYEDYSSLYNPAGAYMGHTGLDISMDIGTPLYSPVTGVVVQDGGVSWETDVDHLQADGETSLPHTGGLRIQLPNGDIVVLGHMSQIGVSVGDQVQAGQPVGYSGNNNGGHLHLEYRVYTPGQTASGYTIVDPRTVPLAANVTGSPAPQQQPGTTLGLFGRAPTGRAFSGQTPATRQALTPANPFGSGISSLFGGQQSNSQLATQAIDRQRQQRQLTAPSTQRTLAPAASYGGGPSVAVSHQIPTPAPVVRPSPTFSSVGNTAQNAVRGLFAGSPAQKKLGGIF